MNMTTERIDIHWRARRLGTARLSLERNGIGISQRNVELIRKFCDDAALGKTVLGRQKKKLGAGRILKYLETLRKIAHWLQEDFDKVTVERMERLIATIERNELQWFKAGRVYMRVNYSEWSRHDIKITIKKFYKWLQGDNLEYPKLVRWIDTFAPSHKIPALTDEEGTKLVEYARGPRDKAAVSLLLELGFRAEELLNVRIQHVQRKDDHFIVTCPYSKTYTRTLPTFRSTRFLEEWLRNHPSPTVAHAQLFPMTYPALRTVVHRLGERVLGKVVTPHILRHTCATNLANNRVGRYQMCKWMGWQMSSRMPDEYIDRSGVSAEETLSLLRENEKTRLGRELTEREDELSRMRQRCSELEFQALQGRNEPLRAAAEKRKAEDDALNEVLSGHPELLDAFARQLLKQDALKRLK